ncbi:DivIVA domain-containing protein [Facklamia hominis]|uniref:DivIVA domain-containing protein n=1 Tax=Facklamia hominis CCUG 36813 TaxID=883111 RepID=K1LHF4_9LACT|nr:DivIVA domain-containing protein [Facklamia hominis]EKB56100.1 DivIVA domain-containing protein [Facklamia hominis CCUG 36813]PKY92607.1 DivIVA domain-containing protein [Facklamia hominis]RYC98216.1 DivIVA domain-containing protein [Facklamia hominis]WPJ90078.1 DivIVA domain-containing protein [Facklamia hominis]
MAVTPNDILNKEFSNKFRGYDPEQVNDFLDIIRVQLEKTLEENKQLAKDLTDANDKINYFNQLQESLNSSIIIAQEAADRLKQNARKEAELILYEAERDADRILRDASDQSSHIFSEVENLREKVSVYRENVRQEMQASLNLLSLNDYDELFEGTPLYTAQNYKDQTTEESQAIAKQKADELLAEADQSVELDNEMPETGIPEVSEFEEITVEEIHPTSTMTVDEEVSDVNGIDETQVFDWTQINESSDSEGESNQDNFGQTIRIDLPVEDEYNEDN